MMQTDEQIALAARLLRRSIEEIKDNSVVIKINGALYVSFPVRGGVSLIVGHDGTVLFADSSIDGNQHFQEFEKGRRTPLDSFK
jgi:hypothetical protein